MRVVAMVSGGKDSCYNMMQCVAEGHEIVALANLHPKDRDELDSYMYQTVGHMGIEILAKAMDLPLYRRETKGKSTQTGKYYVPTDDDEVEDLYDLLAMIKNDLNIEAVAVGAIVSDYQRVRVENVCNRLHIVSLAYLWRRDQTELLQEMIDCQVHAIIIKVAALGLVPDRHLGKSLREIQPHLMKMHEKYGLNVCGEGGEYESFTLDCPLYKQRIIVDDVQPVITSTDAIAPVGYINFTKLSLQPKEHFQSCDVLVKKSLDYIHDINESTYSDLSDPDLSETELELIEKETRLRESLSQNELITRSNSFARHIASSSPIPIVTKSASVDEPTSSSSIGVTGAAEDHVAGAGCLPIYGSNNTAICGSLSLAISAASTSGPFTRPPSPMKFEREFRPLKNQSMAAINQKGWMWVAGIQGCGSTLEDGMSSAVRELETLAKENQYAMTDYCFVTLYVRSIADYPKLNRIYGEAMYFQNPPTRVCVECPLPADCHVIMEAIAFRQNPPVVSAIAAAPSHNDGGIIIIDDHASSFSSSSLTKVNRHTMHVQGISHWAPANIGPYSQSTKVGEITYISGQIALVPGSMTIIEGGIRPQCKLALRHISRIAKAMNAKGQLRDVVHGICFVTHPSFIAEARRQWERRTTNAIMDYIVVPALPREALVEWQVWAHTHNDRFEYEETGCSVSDYTISIRRRWNYENNCAAIVCYVCTGLASSTTQLTQLSEDILINHCRLAQNLKTESLDDILTYVVNRLLKDYPIPATAIDEFNDDDGFNNAQQQQQQQQHQQETRKMSNNTNANIRIPAIHLKVFYQVTALPSIDLLQNAMNDFRTKCSGKAAIVFTILPACSLHNFSTFLSICGVRHE